MKRIITRIFTVIGMMVVFSLTTSLITRLVLAPQTPHVPAAAVLTFDFNTPIAEYPQNSLVDMLKGDNAVPLQALIYALDSAQKDDRIKGAIFNVSDLALDSASVEELRAAILRFKTSQKFVYAFADSFGELGIGNRPYILAAAADKIWLQPLGTVNITGAAVTLPFARDLMDKVGIMPDMRQRYEYKGAMGMFTERTIPPAIKENYQQLINDLTNNMVRHIAETRTLPEAQVRALMDEAPLLGKRALEARLVDALGYEDEMQTAAHQQAGAESKPMNMLDYLATINPPADEKAQAALVYVDGAIVRRDDDRAPMSGDKTASAETLAAAIRSVAENKEMKALVLRVNSPGGSVAASETIYRALMLAKQAGKYIVVSMADTAASGGYWISMPADKIIAEPSTITGSIGVLGGKFVMAGLSEKLGVQWAELGTTRHSTMWSAASPFNKEAGAKIDAAMDEVYTAFIQRVSKGRNLKPEQLDAMARGRVWSGVTAQKLGLVDSLGGLKEATSLVKQHLGVDQNKPLTMLVLPQEPSFVEKLLSGLGLSVELSSLFQPLLFLNKLMAWQNPSAALYYQGGSLLH